MSAAYAFAEHDTPLINRLPEVRGRLTANAPLAQSTWFKVGGPAEVLFKPADTDDLCTFLAACPDDVPVTVMGVASNLLVRDGGVPGVVIRLMGRAFTCTTIKGAQVTACAGALDANVARTCLNEGVGGLEFLSGIPGSIGGAIRMNAGAFGRETSDVLLHAYAVTQQGEKVRLSHEELGFRYRHCSAPDDLIFTGCVLQGEKKDQSEIAAAMAAIRQQRETSQPIHGGTGGSTFKNPEGEKAWQLIDNAGCRGLTVGGAQMSEKHCNFLVNTGTATAHDIETLGETVRQRVHETAGITLDWEIRRIGVPQDGGAA